MRERLEVLVRIVVFIISGIILFVWRYFIILLVLINFFYTLIFGKRAIELADMSEIWNTQLYVYRRYLIFVSNKRPFPFAKLTKNISKCD